MRTPWVCFYTYMDAGEGQRRGGATTTLVSEKDLEIEQWQQQKIPKLDGMRQPVQQVELSRRPATDDDQAECPKNLTEGQPHTAQLLIGKEGGWVLARSRHTPAILTGPWVRAWDHGQDDGVMFRGCSIQGRARSDGPHQVERSGPRFDLVLRLHVGDHQRH